MENLIKSVKENSDYVIAIIHFGKEGSHDLEKEQVESAKKYIDAGASAVVGHHAHVLQGVEIYNDKPIIYNLGDFIFNANTEETAMFQIKLKDDGSMDYYIYPALQKGCFTEFLKENEKQKIIDKLNSWSINAHLESDGKIIKN
jgi:poly-gamma-glutamate synthesis protein (capsule biosynthesis protein)